jgi:hypothetical protein
VTLAQHALNSNPTPYRFAGFSAPFYTQIPDAVFDELLSLLTGAELKVLLYVARRTFGFKKAADDISISQIMHGITTRAGEVLDHGTGLSKDAVTRATKRLVRMGVLLARRNRSRERGNEPTTYALHIRDPLSENRTPPGQNIGQGLVRKSDTQETVEQETERQESFEISKDPPIVDNFVDNCGDNHVDNCVSPHTQAPVPRSPPIMTLITDFSREMGDTTHLGANITQAHRVFASSGMGLDAFFDTLYEARLRTRKATGVRNRMAYFFTVLREMTAARGTGEDPSRGTIRVQIGNAWNTFSTGARAASDGGSTRYAGTAGGTHCLRSPPHDAAVGTQLSGNRYERGLGACGGNV